MARGLFREGVSVPIRGAAGLAVLPDANFGQPSLESIDTTGTDRNPALPARFGVNGAKNGERVEYGSPPTARI